jgi:hypothetical protein
MASFNFNAAEYDDFESNGTFEPIPDGDYELMCEDAEEKTTSSGGTMIKAKFRVLGPEFKNRVIFNNFNIVNKSEKAQDIGRRQLSAWARAVGKPNAQDTDELLNRAFIGVIGTEPASGNYAAQNKINGFKPKEGGAPAAAPKSTPAPAPKPSPAPTAAASASAAPATQAAAVSPAAASPSKGKKAPWDD